MPRPQRYATSLLTPYLLCTVIAVHMVDVVSYNPQPPGRCCRAPPFILGVALKLATRIATRDFCEVRN